MILLDRPYVSKHFLNYLERSGQPVLETPFTAGLARDYGLNLVDDAEAEKRCRNGERLYTSSENALEWIHAHLGDMPVARHIDAMKDKDTKLDPTDPGEDYETPRPKPGESSPDEKLATPTDLQWGMEYRCTQDENGEWIGFDADMARLVAKKLGVDIEFAVIEWDAKVMELQSKSIDVAWNGMTLNDSVLNALNCTNAYCNNAQVVVTAGK